MINALKVMFGLDEALAVYLGLLEIYTSSKYDVRLEYIEASGTQYIDTEIIPNNTPLSVETCVAITNSSQNTTILGSVDDNSNTLRYYPLGCYNTLLYVCNFNGKWSDSYKATISSLSVNTFYTVSSSIGNGSVDIECDGTSKTISRLNGPINKSLYLFARNGTEITSHALCRIKYMKIYLDSRLVSCLVPVKKNNEVCMYDTVRRKLFKNKGTGDFIAGPDKVTYDAKIEYIESSGTQYIDTLYKVTPNMSFSSRIQFVLNEHTNTNTNNGNNNNVFLATSNYEGDYTFAFNFGNTDLEDNDILFWTDRTYAGGGSIYRINDISYDTLKNKFNLNYLSLLINLGTYLISVPLPTHTFTSETLLLFGGKDRAPFNRWNMRIYSMKIYDNNVLIRDFIPVKKNNVGYLYDKVSEQLFGNSGSGSFILGSDIIEIEYLLSSNEQYIETGIIPDANTGIHIKASWNSGEDNYIVGLRNTDGDTRWCIGESGYGWYWGYGNYTKGYNNNYNNYLNITAQSAIVECKLNYLNDSKWYGEGPNNVLVLQTLPTLPFTPSYNIRLFGSAGISADYTKFSGKLYFVKISQGQDVIMDLIPVRVGNVGYMYDKISGQLFGNSGSGTFALGPDKVSTEQNYTKLEYIESTADGGQYIDLNVKLYETLGTNYDVAIKFNIFGPGKNNATNAAIFACLSVTSPWPGTFIRKTGGNTNEIVGRYIGANIKDNSLGTTNTVIELPAKTPPEKNVYNLNNSSNLTHSFGTSLFCVFSNTNNDPKDFTHARLYYFKLFVEGVLIRDMIPCKSNITNAIGLYDKANDVFYTSPNEAVFVAGPDKFSTELNYTKLEYVESTGTQYIDTGFKPNTKSVIVDTEVAITDMTQDGIILGAIDNKNDIRYYLIGFNNEHFYVKNDSGSSNLSLLSPVSITLNEFNTMRSKLASSALILVNNTVSSSMASVAKFNDSKSLYLFANNSSSPSNFIKCKIKYLKIYEDDVLIRDFVPCKNSNDIVGLYDRINNIFYSSQTSLVAGPEILS